MIWGILSVIMLIGVIAGLAYLYHRDRLYMKRRTRDVLSDTVRQEIEDEVRTAEDRQKKFKSALEKAAKLSESQDNSLTKV